MDVIKEERINNFVSQLKGYAATQAELLKLRTVEKVALTGSYLFSVLLPGTVLVIALVFLSIAAALYLSQLLGNIIGGFALVGAGYLLLTLVFFLLKNKLVGRPVQNKIIATLTETPLH